MNRNLYLMLFYGRSYISSIEPTIIQVCEVLDVGQHITAIVRGCRNGVAAKVHQPQLLELSQVHDVVEG